MLELIRDVSIASMLTALTNFTLFFYFLINVFSQNKKGQHRGFNTWRQRK